MTNPADYHFPFTLPGTELEALELTSYEGLYLEDGSKETVSNVAALVLCNNSTELMEKAQIALWQGEEKLCFELNYLPAGEKILVLETNRSQYHPGPVSACAAVITPAEKDIPGLVTIRQVQGKTLLISNPGPLPLNRLTVYFKNYDTDRAMFLGGIVYEIPIYHIAPGESYIAQPQYYTGETSRIVKVKTSG